MERSVLLINPPIYDFAAYDFFNKPLGLLYLGAFLQSCDYRVSLIDALDRNHRQLAHLPHLPKTQLNNTGKYHTEILEKPAPLKHIPRHYRRYGLPENLFKNELELQINRLQPTAVLLTSMMTYWYPAVADTIKLIRQTAPQIPIALGGVYASLMPQHAQQFCQPDKLFVGQNFNELLEWLNQLDNPNHQNQPRQSTPNFDKFSSWPIPAYNLYEKLDYLTLITSLGCPFHCDYCASRILQPALQQLSPDSFMDQLNQLLKLLDSRQQNLKPKRIDVAFMDDALFFHAQKHLIPILQKTKALNLPLRFHCPNGLHCRYVTEELAQLMHDNHFEMIRLSFESAGAAGPWQQASDNKISDRHLINAVNRLESAGFARSQIEGYILTGLPGQTMNEIRQSADFVHQQGAQVRLCHYSPIPHTKLFDTACKKFGVDPNEPLLHNNSILATLDENVSFEEFNQFKTEISLINQNLS